jgi:hypothetical protein
MTSQKVKNSENIKVAVRVRPFSEREKNRRALLIISMKDKETVIMNPADSSTKQFWFDYSYWSHDGYVVRDDGYHAPKTSDSPYVDQSKLFNDLGRGMLENAWKGYNCSIFAYGQTGSGKSFSIMGSDANRGLVPLTCEQLFKEMQSNQKKQPSVIYEVSFSMIEIYNEQVNDLLSVHKAPKGGLQVREDSQKSFYVVGLTTFAVGSYEDIQQRINQGNKKRSIAATKMNETSSRAHTIVSITLTQNNKKDKQSMRSQINLIDLAGSERQKQTESSGDRFTEAKHINQSLSTLGNVISALVENSVRGKGPEVVPFRNSVLTRLLKNALGGNSKTFMIAAISPDAENYEQTLSTLRYADRVKQIKTDAKINQVKTNELIRSLIAEKERLLRDLESARSSVPGSLTDEEIKRIKEEQELELQRYKEQMADMEKAWEKRLAEARKEMEERQAKEREQQEEAKKIPHLSNLNEDAALSNKLTHLCLPGTLKVGREGADIVLHGPGIVTNHAEIRNNNGEIILVPCEGCVLHNGREVRNNAKLRHGDRIRFGSNNLYIFLNPITAEEARKQRKVIRLFTYEDAQEEIVKNSGLDLTSEDRLLQDEVINILPLVQNVNAMAEEMSKSVAFSMLLVSPEARGLDTGRTELYIKVTNKQTGNEYLWTKAQFLTRQAYMQEMYQQFEESGCVPDANQEDDPFWEPDDLEVVVGVASLPLKFLSYMIEFKEDPLTVLDYTAQSCGYLEVQLIPCDEYGTECPDMAVDDPADLVGKKASFMIKVCKAMNLPPKYVTTRCRYKFYEYPEYICTDEKPGQNPNYDHKYIQNIPNVDFKLMEYLQEKSMAIEILGRQGGRSSSKPRKIQSVPDNAVIVELNEKVRKLERKLEATEKIVKSMSHSIPQRAELLQIIKG